MRQSKTPRVVAAIFLGLLFGAYRHFQQVRQLSSGRDQFLADQSRYFDRITQTHSASFMLIAGVLLACIAVGLYEGLAFGFSKLIPPVQVED
ncbi:MAG TPA: hypothetical protein VJU82_13535 [Acidobacteriaceae bacterium]|nr:hypothetical protein [Acidobacteriaceae bacterium]